MARHTGLLGDIDQLVDAKLKKLRVEPSGTCSDEAFARRVFLDITGLLGLAT